MLRSRRGRWILIACLLVASGILWGLYRHFFDSQRMAEVVASRLQTAYGGPVQIGAADIGLESSTLHDLRIFEIGAKPTDEPWMTVDRVYTDLSAATLLHGDGRPQSLTLDGVVILLRFDASGHLQNGLPRPGQSKEVLPLFRIRNARLTLRQEGHPDFVITGVDATLTDNKIGLSVYGTAADPNWGNWTVTGHWDKPTAVVGLYLFAPTMHVTQAMLDRLPFVPAKVWRQVQCEGDTPVAIEVSHQPPSKQMPGPLTREGLHYSITLDPVATSVHVTSIDLHAAKAHGNVVIADKFVYLDEVQGIAAGGEIKTDGTLDFRAKPSQMQFAVEVRQIDLQRLPPTWRLPAQVTQRLLTGHLSGKADLKIAVADGKAKTSGEGQGEITDTRLAGIPVKKPVKLALHADDRGFRFSIPGIPVGIGIKAPKRDAAKPAPGGDRRP